MPTKAALKNAIHGNMAMRRAGKGRHFTRTSIVAAKNGHEIVAPFAFKGSMDGDLFEGCLAHIFVPELKNPHKSVLILDNYHVVTGKYFTISGKNEKRTHMIPVNTIKSATKLVVRSGGRRRRSRSYVLVLLTDGKRFRLPYRDDLLRALQSVAQEPPDERV